MSDGPAGSAGMPGGGRPAAAPDVVVLGEVLVELSSLEPLAEGATLRLAFSGDALNAAAAAAAAGARTVLVARVPEDELGDALVARVAALGIGTEGIVRVPGQHGIYLTHADPQGAREFVYARRGSAGSGLHIRDLDDDLLSSAGVVLASGVACAISPSAADAVQHAARLARRFVYDPNLRPRLIGAEQAASVLRDLAPLSEVITPSWPGETQALLGLGADTRPVEAARRAADLGAGAVVLTCGPRGAVVVDGDHGDQVHEVPGVPAAVLVDQTGAGDCLAGTLAARLALGDPLLEAVRLGVAAASLSVQGRGGTGHVPTLAETRNALAGLRPAEEMSPR